MEVPIRSIHRLPDEVTGPIRLSIPFEFRRGVLKGDERKSIASALAFFKETARRTGWDDWQRLTVLDYGCGVKFTQALLQYDVPVRRYVGMDNDAALIDHLKARVDSPSFSFFYVPFYNEMYPTGDVPMTADAQLPGEWDAYDLITLQSVFTHLQPADFAALAEILRRYVAPDGRMVFTCRIDDGLAGDFLDAVPGKPSFKVLYREHRVRQMLVDAGWQVLSLDRSSFSKLDFVVCRPA